MDWARAGRVAAVTALAAGIATAYWWAPRLLRRMSFFAVRRIEVQGAHYRAPREVIAALALGSGASVFDDLGAVERRLASQRGIAQAQVRRRLPGTLVVRVTEVEPVAMAEGPDGMVALGADGTPLPYDLAATAVDAPVVNDADPKLVTALAAVQASDRELYQDVEAARMRRGELVLEVGHGLVRVGVPVNAEAVRAAQTVRQELDDRGNAWREIDGRFGGWVVVRKPESN